MSNNISATFGSMVFSDAVMKERLPRETYRIFKETIAQGKALDLQIANVMASAMKDWAVENGATHYTHWFQPMTGITAEKHEGFISPKSDGTVIMEFSGKELIKGEPDASSFPSGGLRATFEARGYTAWDPTSYAFIKEGVLCIPTAFCSYGGEALDKKTPLLKSMDVIGREALRLLKKIGVEASSVTTTVGAEQEYFLIDRALYEKRRDLVMTGRTLFGARPVKGQELEDHYFGNLKPRVKAFMEELDDELYRLGIPAKTEHNEAAPSQHELAPIYETTNIANDHNQLMMEMMRKVALRHGLVCILTEKPFAGVNGSGKHNNWSLITDSGKNLLDPGKDPYNNNCFLLMLCAVIAAVDDYQDLLRISVATCGNDYRLGAGEAPPAVISMFLGDDLTDMLESIEAGTEYSAIKAVEMEGAKVLPHFMRDTADRNRTSPFAFTGNKFEFRSLGASLNIAEPNIMLNTIVADALHAITDRLDETRDLREQVCEIVRDTMRAHKRILFNGNNYTSEWVEEAARRGLLNFRSTPEAVPHLCDEKNVVLFEKYGVLNRVELNSRMEINSETYGKLLHIEALTMLEMANREIFPGVIAYLSNIAEEIHFKKTVAPAVPCDAEEDLLARISGFLSDAYSRVKTLEKALHEVAGIPQVVEKSQAYRRLVFPAMTALRASVDEMEPLVGKEYWAIPTYTELLFSV